MIKRPNSFGVSKQEGRKMPKALVLMAGVKTKLWLGGKCGKPWLPSLTLPELAAMFPPDWEVAIWDENTEGAVPVELIKTCDLVALSGLTPAYYRMLDITQIAQQASVQIVVGGRHVIGQSLEKGGDSKLLEQFPSICTTHCDTALMSQIAADAEQGQLQPHYRLPEGKPAEFVLPRHDLIVPGRRFVRRTNRSSEGCNNRCAWCTVGGCGYFLKPGGLLEKEVNSFHGDFFVDVADSFAGSLDYHEDASIPGHLTDVILPIYKRSGSHWGTEATVADLLREKNGECLINLMAAAGCRVIYIGVESVTRQLHAKSSKATTEEVIRRCRKAGMVVIGSLILDAHGDETDAEIREMVRWARRWLDFPQFSLVALLLGTRLREIALKNGTIISWDWEDYDGANPTCAHVLTPRQRRYLHREAYLECSRLSCVLERTLHTAPRYMLPVFLGGLRYRKGIPHA